MHWQLGGQRAEIALRESDWRHAERPKRGLEPRALRGGLAGTVGSTAVESWSRAGARDRGRPRQIAGPIGPSQGPPARSGTGQAGAASGLYARRAAAGRVQRQQKSRLTYAGNAQRSPAIALRESQWRPVHTAWSRVLEETVGSRMRRSRWDAERPKEGP